MNEESLLNTLATHHKWLQQAQRQETKDSVICQLVMLLRQFVPSKEAKDKIEEILREYNAEERIPEQDKIYILIDDVFVGQMRQSLEDLEQADKLISKNMFSDFLQMKQYPFLLGGIVTLKELIEKCKQQKG